MKKLLFILFCTLTCLTDVSAQAILQSSYEIKHAFDFYLHHKSRTEILNATLTSDDIQGSPYLSDDFIEGTIYTTSKTQFMSVPLRYNIYNDQIEFKNADGQIYAIAAPEVIEKIELGEYQIEHIPIQTITKISKNYLIALEKGNASLYSRQKINLQHEIKAEAYKDAQPAKFIRRPDEYYIRIGMEAAKPVSKKKDLKNIFPDKEKEINAFIKDNKIRTGNAESLRELVVYYNTL